MRILGVIGSSRLLGNTEVLVAEVARAAARCESDTEPEIRLLHLTDLRLDYCTGCMLCADPESPGDCPLEDDMDFLLRELRDADALVWGAPSYTLLPPGPVKLVADRLIMALGKGAPGAGKPAVTVGVAGLPHWSELLLPLINAVTLGFGFVIADSMMAYGAGPGEVLRDPSNLTRARAAGERLHRALGDPSVRPSFGPGRCPICGADCFQFTEQGIRCPICLAEGQVRGGTPDFPDSPHHRWEPAALQHHFVHWIQQSRADYFEKRREIRRVQAPYRHLAPLRVKPPRQ